MKKFPWDCGDCPLLASWDMSCDDMTYKCLWSKRQIDDCDRYLSDVCPMEKHDEEIRADARRKCGEELLTIINEKPCGIEKKNLWLISQIKHFCFGVPRICDVIEGDAE